MARLDDLKWALEIARESIAAADVDKRSPLLAQFRALLEEIAELEGSDSSESQAEVNGLVILQEEIAKRRQSGASGSRRASGRNV